MNQLGHTNHDYFDAPVLAAAWLRSLASSRSFSRRVNGLGGTAAGAAATTGLGIGAAAATGAGVLGTIGTSIRNDPEPRLCTIGSPFWVMIT